MQQLMLMLQAQTLHSLYLEVGANLQYSTCQLGKLHNRLEDQCIQLLATDYRLIKRLELSWLVWIVLVFGWPI
jgi:hypothetical protein